MGVHKYVTVEEMAEKLAVSVRTIRNYIDEVNEELEAYHAEIVKKPGVGIKLVGSKKDIEQYIKQTETIVYSQQLKPEERQWHILQRLYLGNVITYKELAEEFFISRAAIANDFKQIKTQLDKSVEQLKYDNNGTYIEIDEKSRQLALAKGINDYYSFIYGEYPYHFNEYIAFIKNHIPYLSETIIDTVTNALQNLTFKYQLGDHYNVQLHLHLSLLLMRLLNDTHINKENFWIVNQIEMLETYQVTYDLCRYFEKQLGVHFTEEDIWYLNEQLIASGFNLNKQLSDDPFFQKIVYRLIQKFELIIGHDFSSDQKLKNGLMNHLVPMFFRLKNRLIIKNPYLLQLQKQYRLMFYLTWFLTLDIEEELGEKIPEDEIGFFMVHFQSALERVNRVRKILIVSQLGLLTAELLEMRIKKVLPNFDVFETIHMADLETYDLSNIDCIISTTDLAIEGIKVIRISPIPTEQELQHLAEETKKISRDPFHFSNDVFLNNKGIFNYLSEGDIYIGKNFKAKNDILDFLLNTLEQEGKVEKAYRESVYGREALSTTAFETSVAIPHGNPEYVTETSLKILINDTKIVWNGEKVDVVILVSVAPKDLHEIKGIISEIYELIATYEMAQKIFKNKTAAEIYYLIGHKEVLKGELDSDD